MQAAIAEVAARTQRAYSVFSVKSMDEDKRELEGWATTPTTDRMGDVVEPDGAEFKLPIPLLWQHDSSQPIGHVISAKVSKDGIYVKARLAKVSEPGKLKDRLDEAWQSIKAGLVRAFSIGFRSLEDANIKETFGIRFMRWELLELSAVTIPANAEASITAIKSADQQARAASGEKRKAVVRLEITPGASGQTAAKKQGSKVKTIKEQLSAFEAKRAANVARMAELMNTASEKGETLDAAGAEEHDGLKVEVKQIDEHIVRLKDQEEINKANAVEVKQEAGTDARQAAAVRAPAGSIRVTSNLPKGMAFTRMVLSKAIARLDGVSAIDVVRQNERWMKQTPEVERYLKTGVAGGTSTASAWADDLVYAQNLVSEFIELLHPATVLGKLNLRKVPFNIRVGSQTSGGTGYWVGEAQPIPASKLQTDVVSMTIAKAAGLMVITKELARLSAPSAEELVRSDLMKTVTEFLDKQFLDPNYGPVTSTGAPGSITYGVTGLTPTGTTAAALRNDIATTVGTFLSNNLDPSDCVWIMSPNIALQIGLITQSGIPQFPQLGANGGSLAGFPVITSYSAYVAGSPDYAHMMLLVKPSEIFLADEGGMEVSVSDTASIQMDDAPTNNTSTPTATSMVSMFQDESVAIKLVRYINWKKRRSTAVNWIRTAAYKDA